MRIEVNMTTSEEKFVVEEWWGKSPDFIVSALQKQLEAATAIWPELNEYRVAKTQSRKARGVKGGLARAAAMSPEQRSEVAKAAANVRWNRSG